MQAVLPLVQLTVSQYAHFLLMEFQSHRILTQLHNYR